MKTHFSIISTDDDRDDQEFLIEIIKEINVKCDVVCVSDGTQLMDLLLKKNKYEKSISELPDLIILDLNMPLMDGYEVLKRIRVDGNLKNIPVCILTTSHNEADKKRSIASGADGFYSKPMSHSDLVVIVKEIFTKYLQLSVD